MGAVTTLGELVLARGTPIRLAAGDTVFSEGDRSDSVYACRSGELKVTVSTPSGDELLLGLKRPGDGFGELSAIDGAPRSARVVAVVDSELAVLGRAAFLDALAGAPEVAVGVLVELSDLLRRSNERVTATRSEPIPVRVAHRLIELCAQVHRHRGTGGRCELAITQDDLAGWVGATRESTARALGSLRRRGIVETGRGRIVVRDEEALRRVVRDSGR